MSSPDIASSQAADPPVFLELRNIRKTFGGVKALDDVSFSIREGETYCLMGENGSGKSTLIKVISGVYQADSGEIVLNGRTMSRITPTESIQAGIQIIYQDFSIFPNLSVAENIAPWTSRWGSSRWPASRLWPSPGAWPRMCGCW